MYLDSPGRSRQKCVLCNTVTQKTVLVNALREGNELDSTQIFTQ